MRLCCFWVFLLKYIHHQTARFGVGIVREEYATLVSLRHISNRLAELPCHHQGVVFACHRDW